MKRWLMFAALLAAPLQAQAGVHTDGMHLQGMRDVTHLHGLEHALPPEPVAIGSSAALQRVSGQADAATRAVNEATGALQANKTREGKRSLGQAWTALQTLRDALPGGALVRRLDGALARNDLLDLRQVTSQLEADTAFIDPSAVAAIQSGQRDANVDLPQARQSLASARARLVADNRLGTIDDALRRVSEAKRLVDSKQPAEALRQLSNVPVQLQLVVRDAPLVSARANLRGASSASKAGDHARAAALLQLASSQLSQAQKSPELDRVSSEVQALAQSGTPSATDIDRAERDAERLDQRPVQARTPSKR